MAILKELVQSTEPKDFDMVAASSREGRQLTPYSPIFFWVGWIVVAYFVISLFAYVVPQIFGYPPGYYYRPPFARNLHRRRRTTTESDGWSLSSLTADIMSQIDSFVQKFQTED